MSRSPDRRSSLERGSPETKPRSCGNQSAHESLFNRRLRVLSPAVRTSEPTSSAAAETNIASEPLSEPLKANMSGPTEEARNWACLLRGLPARITVQFALEVGRFVF
jgi:hypothetical protein